MEKEVMAQGKWPMEGGRWSIADSITRCSDNPVTHSPSSPIAINRLPSKVAAFLRMPLWQKLLCIEAAFWLGAARLAIGRVPLRLLVPFLGRHKHQSPEVATDRETYHFRRVTWAVRTMSRNVPWECKCLAQCIAGKIMLRRRGVACTLYLGLAKGAEKPLEAHAWLRTGHCYHLFSTGNDTFSIVATFA